MITLTLYHIHRHFQPISLIFFLARQMPPRRICQPLFHKKSIKKPLTGTKGNRKGAREKRPMRSTPKRYLKPFGSSLHSDRTIMNPCDYFHYDPLSNSGIP